MLVHRASAACRTQLRLQANTRSRRTTQLYTMVLARVKSLYPVSLRARNMCTSTSAAPISANAAVRSSPWPRIFARTAVVTGAASIWYFWPWLCPSDNSESDLTDFINKYPCVLVLDLDEYGIVEDNKLPPSTELKVCQMPYAVECGTQCV